jgi:hypothetical protein
VCAPVVVGKDPDGHIQREQDVNDAGKHTQKVVSCVLVLAIAPVVVECVEEVCHHSTTHASLRC